ncbi:MAG TPA: hypothetical protein VES38_06825 [Methylotenera sp.]|nr:hypothetical protein [Methylotenera sp.]
MTFLQICQRLRQEAGISGIGPSTVVSQTGEMRRIVDWVNTAYEDIQLARSNWNWMRGDFSFNTTANDYDYTAAEAGIASRFSQWDVDTIKSFRTSVGVSNEFELGELFYSHYRSIYLTGSQSADTPVCFSIGPDRKLLLGPKPNGIFTVSGQYWKSPQVLAANADEPEMPAEYHMLIVWMALEQYGLYESAGECVMRGQKNSKRYMNRLEINQLPDVGMANPLA